jgi:hypothetical protein
MNADYVIVGNVTGAVLLGFYLLAFNVSSWVPGVISTAIRQVSVAGFSRLSEHTPEALSAGVTRSVPLLVTGLVPIAVLLAVLAPQLVDVLFGAQWEPAAAVLRWLVVLTVVRMLTSFALDILTGAGATRATFWLNLGWALALIPALLGRRPPRGHRRGRRRPRDRRLPGRPAARRADAAPRRRPPRPGRPRAGPSAARGRPHRRRHRARGAHQRAASRWSS